MKFRHNNHFLLWCLVLLSTSAEAKLTASDSSLRLNSKSYVSTFKSPFNSLEHFTVSGYYRFMGNYRNMTDAYAHMENNKKSIFIGDDAQIPQFMLNLNGYTDKNTSFGTDLFMWTPLTGLGQTENVKGLNLGISLYGNFKTRIGNLNVRTGGINWYAMTPFTFQTNKGYNRYSLFERNPWDPNTNQIDDRYKTFYNTGAMNQDQRWGNQAFQGLIIDGTDLPGQTAVSLMLGKTQFDGGYSPIPNYSYGGKLKKYFDNNKASVSLNTFNSTAVIDSIKLNTAGFNMISVEYAHQFNQIKVYSEIGSGRRFANDVFQQWGEALSVKISSMKKRLPIEMHAYRISPRVLNNSAIFINSSIQQSTVVQAGQTQPVLMPVASSVLPIGQLSNNRQGFDINGVISHKRWKHSIGYSVAGELEALSSQLNYTHAFNALPLSRFWRWDFPSNIGPYGQMNKLYRTVIETVNLKDVDITGKPVYKKYFNTIELNSKYSSYLMGKPLYLFYLGSFNSVQYQMSPMVVTTEKALLRTYDHQIESYWRIQSHLVWTNYVSYERILANYQTQTDIESRRPKNQVGYAFATGFDIQLSKSVGLYLRHRLMNYRDKSYSKDYYKGQETTVELKAFF